MHVDCISIVRLQNLINEPTNIIFLLQNSAENQIGLREWGGRKVATAQRYRIYANTEHRRY